MHAEYRLDGHIEGSTNLPAFSWEHGFYLPSANFVADMGEEHASDAPIILICADGSLSAGAAAELVAAGFIDVRMVEGGLRAWEEAAAEGDVVPELVIDEEGEGGLTGAWV